MNYMRIYLLLTVFTVPIFSLSALEDSKTIAKPQIEIKNKHSFLPRWATQWLLAKKQTPPIINADYQLDGLVGTYPAKLYWIIDQLKLKHSPLLSNRLILYGPPGNGKSTLARVLAQKTNCEFITLNGPSVVGSYLGEGAQKIRELFEFAAEKYEKSKKKQIIFVDEVDAICRANINYEAAARAEHQVATQELWLALDKYKNHPGIFFICATNHFDKLDRTFLDRFNTNTLEIKNPDEKGRKNILLHYLAKHDIAFEEALLDTIVKQSDGLSNRCLEDLILDVAIATRMYGPAQVTADTVLDILQETKKKFEEKPHFRKKSWREFFSLSTQDAISCVHYGLTLPLSAFQLYNYLRPLVTKNSIATTATTVLNPASFVPAGEEIFEV